MRCPNRWLKIDKNNIKKKNLDQRSQKFQRDQNIKDKLLSLNWVWIILCEIKCSTLQIQRKTSFCENLKMQRKLKKWSN